MGVHSLVTGLNGAGKSLYSVSTKLAPLVETDDDGKRKVSIAYRGRDIPRRLVVGGIPQLLLEHELMDVPEIDPDDWVDLWRKVDRRGGEPPVRWVVKRNGAKEADYYEACDEDDSNAEPVVCSFVCWWLWVEPGDYVVVDEAQRVFRPLASGKRVPRFIARLETARHYGIELLYMTQHPQLLHANVRALCGPHEDVQRIFGSGSVMVCLWERTSSPGATAKATKRIWRHDKKAFALYKSSELHTKFSQRKPLAVWVLPIAVVALGVLGWKAWTGVNRSVSPSVPSASLAASAPGGGTLTGLGPLGATQQPPQARASPPPTWPVYSAGPVVATRDPLEGRAVQYEGGYVAGAQRHGTFGLVIEGERVATVSLAQLVRMGYAFTELGPCAGILRYRETERVITCPRKSPVLAPDRSQPPAAAASQPSV